jgi:nitroimidazol reductase NimA-like FMN-containing flavoprotein (pyridoxamine 5'-phosphate oxidase superfamily)
MTETQCREALSGHSYGRLAFALEDGPTILPVNYAYVEGAIVIRTASGSKLASVPMTTVAFEVDEIAPDHMSGWSVLARGHAFDITTAIDELSETLRELPFMPWLHGEKGHVIKINVREVSGRQFS